MKTMALKVRLLLAASLLAAGGSVLGSTAPAECYKADANDDGRLDIADAVYVLNHLFAEGPEPAAFRCDEAPLGPWVDTGRLPDDLHLAGRSLRVRSRITSQSWRPDLRQIWSRSIEQNRRDSSTISRILRLRSGRRWREDGMAECEVILERTLTAYEGYLYATQGSYGDQGPGSGYKGTFYAPILPDGRLGEWRQTTDRNLYRWNFGVGTKSGYLYLVGGQTGAPASTVTDVVEYARINPDGSLGAWHLAERLGQSRSARPGVVIAQGHLYAIGGEYMGRGLRSVEHAPILPDGSLGPWEFTSELEIPRPYATAAVLGGHVYVFGGEVHSFETDTVERAPINSDGTLGQWDVVGSLPETRGNHAMAMVADRVFLLGGVAAPMGSVERWSIARSDVRPDHGLNGWQTWGIGEDIRARMGSPRLHTFSWGPWIYISRQGTGSPLARARMCCYAPCCGGSVHDR